MGGVASKKKSKHYGKYVRSLTEKIRLLQADINEMMSEREKETRTYESDLVVFALKKAEWKQVRQRLKEEVKRLRKMVEEKEERIRGMEDGMVGNKSDKDWKSLGTSSLLVEQMREERVWHDEAVKKWKLLYLAIKTELDDLIQRTDHGDGLYWRAEEEVKRAEEEDMTEELRNEIKAKEETIEALKARITSMEHEGYKRETEIAILRQSLRIVSSTKASHIAKKLS